MKTYEELKKENAALVAERDALAAQVEALTKTVIEAKDVYEEFSLFVWKSFVVEGTNSARVCNRRQIYEMIDEKFQSVIPDEYAAATPKQILAQIRADAGRAGFIAGYEAGHAYRFANIGDELADEYAAKVREGGTV